MIEYILAAILLVGFWLWLDGPAKQNTNDKGI